LTLIEDTSGIPFLLLQEKIEIARRNSKLIFFIVIVNAKNIENVAYEDRS
jgi:hypothetical protein